MRVVLTGGRGFLGWHTRARLQTRGGTAALVEVGANFGLARATALIEGADRVVHMAGVNRGTDEEIEYGNMLFARQLGQALEKADSPPSVVVFANSIQAGTATTYGRSKKAAAKILRGACHRAGVEFVDLKLPNLFGEHGRPFYNSVVATFCHLLSKGETPQIQEDRDLTLLHVQKAASWLLGETKYPVRSASAFTLSVSALLNRLIYISATYAQGDVPDLTPIGNRDLFNTYRSALIGPTMPISAEPRRDERGTFFEVIRNRGGLGQTSFSTTHPGVTRGQHYHLNKIERFTVLSGEARISMRRLFHDEELSFEVNGDEPVSIDMPTLWAHKIENIGTTPLYTMFWANEIFNPDAPDTFVEDV